MNGESINGLTPRDGKILVNLAREAIQVYLMTQKKISVPKDLPAHLYKNSGAFVTLLNVLRGRELRGCIGQPLPVDPLTKAVIYSAVEAAVRDPRFPPVKLEELEKEIAVEVSVLTPPEQVSANNPRHYIKNICVGRDGLIVEKGWNKGLLLPQVPLEWNWDEEEFLTQCCLKAGLAPDEWLLEGTKIYRFQAVVFEEQSPRGQITVKDMKNDRR